MTMPIAATVISTERSEWRNLRKGAIVFQKESDVETVK